MIDVKNPKVAAYLNNLDRLQDRFLPIRDTMLSAAPQLNEDITWKDCLMYSLGKKNLIQTVLGKDKISLIFHSGAALEHNDGWLEDDGRETRPVRFLLDDFDHKILAKIVVAIVTMANH